MSSVIFLFYLAILKRFADKHTHCNFGNRPTGFDTAGTPAHVVGDAEIFKSVKVESSAPAAVYRFIVAYKLRFDEKFANFAPSVIKSIITRHLPSKRKAKR